MYIQKLNDLLNEWEKSDIDFNELQRLHGLKSCNDCLYANNHLFDEVGIETSNCAKPEMFAAIEEFADLGLNGDYQILIANFCPFHQFHQDISDDED